MIDDISNIHALTEHYKEHISHPIVSGVKRSLYSIWMGDGLY